MITLFATGPMFNLPQASPFAIKAEMLLKLAGVDYTTKTADLRKAPKGKMPWIDDAGTIIADSAFIKKHLEDKYGADFSGHFDARAGAIGLCAERMVEDHFYWMNVTIRWFNDENFYKGPAHFFKSVPALIRPLIIKKVRKSLRDNLHAQGLGRHTEAERHYLATLAVGALSDLLGDQPYILGERVSGYDASVFGGLASAEADYFESPLGDLIRSHDNLVTYLKRIKSEFFQAKA